MGRYIGFAACAEPPCTIYALPAQAGIDLGAIAGLLLVGTGYGLLEALQQTGDAEEPRFTQQGP